MYDEKSNGNFKIPFAKTDVKEKLEPSPVKKPRMSK